MHFVQLILLNVSLGGCINSTKLNGLRAAMSKVTVRNELAEERVKISESNTGTSFELTRLGPGKSCVIKNDKNATCQEFIFDVLPDKGKLRVLTSDDFEEFKEISILKEDDGRGNSNYYWMGTVKRKSTRRRTAQGAQAIQSQGKIRSAVTKFYHVIGVNSKKIFQK